MNTSYKQLTRSTSNRMIAGLCAGLGEYLRECFARPGRAREIRF